MPEEIEKITFKVRKSWSSSYTRAIRAAARKSSKIAIQRAAEKGIPISYLKDGAVVTELLPKPAKQKKKISK